MIDLVHTSPDASLEKPNHSVDQGSLKLLEEPDGGRIWGCPVRGIGLVRRRFWIRRYLVLQRTPFEHCFHDLRLICRMVPPSSFEAHVDPSLEYPGR